MYKFKTISNTRSLSYYKLFNNMIEQNILFGIACKSYMKSHQHQLKTQNQNKLCYFLVKNIFIQLSEFWIVKSMNRDARMLKGATSSKTRHTSVSTIFTNRLQCKLSENDRKFEVMFDSNLLSNAYLNNAKILQKTKKVFSTACFSITIDTVNTLKRLFFCTISVWNP